MTGYKVFRWAARLFSVDGWTGPFYSSPPSWKVAVGKVLSTKDIDTNTWSDCGPGVNFFQNLKDAKEFVSAYVNSVAKYVVIYKVQTTKDAILVKVTADANVVDGYSHWKLARANKVKLVKRVALYKNGRLATKKR